MMQMQQTPQAPGQAPAPGQAVPGALPAVLAQQTGATPPPQFGQLVRMPVDQLKQMFYQSMQPGSAVQPLTVLAAIKQASENQKLQQAVMGQQAAQQVAQQPGTVRDAVLAEATPPQPQFAGGGIVALNGGGSLADKLDEDPTGTKELIDALAASGYIVRQPNKSPRVVPPEPPAAPLGKYNTASPAALAAMQQGLDAAGYEPPAWSVASAYQNADRPARLDAPPPAAAKTPTSGTKATSAAPATGAGGAAPGGLNALVAALSKRALAGPDAQLGPLSKELAANTQEQSELLKRLQATTPEEAAARKAYYDAMQGAYAPQRKALEEAKAATKQGLLDSPEAMLRLAAAFGSEKRLPKALSAASEAAGNILGERRKRAETMESQLQGLESQLAMTMAQAQRADAMGDEQRKRELLLKAAELKNTLTQHKLDLLKTGSEMGYKDVHGLAGLLSAQAHLAQAAKPDASLALYRAFLQNPEGVRSFLSAQQAPKTEGAEMRAIMTEAMKNPVLMSTLPPAIQAAITRAILQETSMLGGTVSTPPTNAAIRN